MTPRHIYLLAAFYTLMMVALTELGMFPHPGAILLAVANVWFWMGHLSGRAINGARLGAVGVTVENVKLVLHQMGGDVYVVTALKPQWPARGPQAQAELGKP